MPRSPLWAHRLSRKADFARIRRRGRRHKFRGATLHLLPRREGPARLGLVIPRKVGNAVRRNRIRRMVRAWAWRALPTAHAMDGVLAFHTDPGRGLEGVLRAMEAAWTP